MEDMAGHGLRLQRLLHTAAEHLQTHLKADTASLLVQVSVKNWNRCSNGWPEAATPSLYMKA